MSAIGQNKTYLSLDKQERVISRMEADISSLPLKDKFFLDYAPHIAYVANVLPAFVSWRAGFRGYNLVRFGRGRSVTLSIVVIFPANAAMVHMANLAALKSPFRSEQSWTYALRSALLEQIGLLLNIAGPLAFTFVYAKTHSMIPIPDEMHKKVNRKAVCEQLFGRLRPYAKGIAISSAISTAAMAFVGWAEYRNSLNVLALQNRKTIALKED